MTHHSRTSQRRLLPWAVLLLVGALVLAPDAQAQARGRSGTGSERGNTERVERKSRAQKPAARQQRSSSETKSRARTERPSRSERATKAPARTRQQPAARSRSSQPAARNRSTTQRSPSSSRSSERQVEVRRRGQASSGQERARSSQQRAPERQARTSQSPSSRSSREAASGRSRTQPSNEANRSRERSARTPSSPSRTERGTSQRGAVNRGTNRSTQQANPGRRSTRERPGNSSARQERSTTNRQRSRTQPSQPERSRSRATTRQPSDRNQVGTRTPSREPQRSVRNRQDRNPRTYVDGSRGRTATSARRDATRVTRNTGYRRAEHRDIRNRRVYYHDQRHNIRYLHRNYWHDYYRHHNYRKKHWKRRSIHVHHHYPIVVRPRVHVDIYWPWVNRYHHGWRPRYSYRQVIYVDAGWGNHRRQSQIDVQTFYYHELRHATADRAEVDIYVERIELYENGRYLGEIDRIPEQLGRIRATVHRDGYVDFDRDVFILGDTHAGFELISTPFYNDFVLDAYQSSHGVRAGVINLRQGRVVPTSYSRLFNPRDFNGYVPVSLLPEDADWLLDYGNASFSAAYYDYDPYYYGGYSNYDDYDDASYGDDYYEEDYYEDAAGRPYYSVRSTVAEANFGVAPLTQAYDQTYQTQFGARIHLKRETEFVRVK